MDHVSETQLQEARKLLKISEIFFMGGGGRFEDYAMSVSTHGPKTVGRCTLCKDVKVFTHEENQLGLDKNR